MENMYNSANRGFDNLFKSVLTEDIDSKKTTKKKSLSESVKKNNKKVSNRISEKLSLIRKNRISEAMRRVRRPIAEAQMSPEDERDSALIRSAARKRHVRANAKLTQDELSALERNGYTVDGQHFHTGSGTIKTPSMTVYSPSSWYKGQLSADDTKVNFADMGRKHRDRVDAEDYYSGRGFKKQPGDKGSVFARNSLTKSRALQNANMESKYYDMKKAILDRKDSQNKLSNLDAEYDDAVKKASDEFNAKINNARKTRDSSRSRYTSYRDDAQQTIDKLLKRDKKESVVRRKSKSASVVESYMKRPVHKVRKHR